jgi:hypothetical protein
MAKYLLVYHGGSQPATQEEGAQVMGAWMQWFGQLGPAVVDGGSPTNASKTIDSTGAVSDGGGANPVTGYSILQADSLDAAVALAKGCPHLSRGGSVEVTEAVQVG